MDRFTGKIWVLGDDIDTDIIIPTEYLALKTVQDMAPYAFSPLRPELAGQIREGDMIVAGKNFGCGSSREQAPEIIKALGVKCVIAKSFARIFFRNAINNGLLLIENDKLQCDVKEGDEITVAINESIDVMETVCDHVASAESGGYPQCGRPGEGDAETKWAVRRSGRRWHCLAPQKLVR